ncbi:MAG TPA: hypothetical protein VFQ53_03810 [Kofleriaceae bacterium]|nr:hypothetical protein [Kofleriaceae bacterium]
MAYRDDSADAIEAVTAEGTLRAELGPRIVKLTVASRTLHIVDEMATLIEHRRKDKRQSFKIAGRLITARDVPHEDFGIWLELPGGVRRIFGVEPVNLLEPEGLPALATLDRLAHRVRAHLGAYARDIRRAFEIGRGLDKVLVADRGDRFLVYARRLFRDRARLVLEVHDDGCIVIHDAGRRQELTVRSRFGITVIGDFIRFAAPDGRDLGRVAIPWIAPEDRLELARRIGQLVDAEPVGIAVAYP